MPRNISTAVPKLPSVFPFDGVVFAAAANGGSPPLVRFAACAAFGKTLQEFSDAPLAVQEEKSRIEEWQSNDQHQQKSVEKVGP